MTVSGHQVREGKRLQQGGVGGGVFASAPLAGHHMSPVVGNEQAPLIWQVDPVNKQLVVDFPGGLNTWGGDRPAPGPAPPQSTSGVAGDLSLGELTC